MSLDTYTNLKLAVQDWINKSSIAASSDDFIALAEAYLNQELRLRRMEVLKEGTISANPIVLSTELTRHLRVRSMSIAVGGAGYPLQYAPQDIRTSRFNDVAASVPEYYTIIGNDLYVAPAPDDTYSYELLYTQGLDPLITAVGNTNWLLESHPNIYLNAALTEAAIYAKDQNAAQGYIALRDRYVGMLKEQDKRDYPGGTSRMITEAAVV